MITVPAVDLDSRIEAFESAWFRDGVAHLADYLPSRNDPLYMAVLRELACVEVELSWQSKNRRGLEDYRSAYPELFEHRESLEALAYQEYRLRRDSGESVIPADYARQYGLNTEYWTILSSHPAHPLAAQQPSEQTGEPTRVKSPETTASIETGPTGPTGPTGLTGPTGPTGLTRPNGEPTRRESWREQIAELFSEHRRYEQTQVTDVHTPTPLGVAFLGSSLHADLLLQLQGNQGQAHLGLSNTLPYPKPGTDFSGFRLLHELGRGAFGRVFLAEQQGLANRKVVLKIGYRLLDESQVMAQLQHTNVVPIYSEHVQGPLQAVCMPYLGSVTLEDVLSSMRKSGGVPVRGNALWDTLRQRREREKIETKEVPSEVPSSLSALRQMNHVTGVLWLTVRLADGLGHAHEHGVLHRDIKPANILLNDDGQPLLLDFNLSQHTRLRSGVPALFGGTLPYMAPEHLEAFVGGDKPVDNRSDLYALGLVLFELLTGVHPFPIYKGQISEQIPRMLADRVAGPPQARLRNEMISPAVESILQKCLHPDPAKRYQNARHLQEDAQRQLDDLPLRHTPELSLRERLGKSWRRHRQLAWAFGVFTLAVLLFTLGWFYLLQKRTVARAEAETSLRLFRQELASAAMLLSLPFPNESELYEGELLCRKALARFGLPPSVGSVGSLGSVGSVGSVSSETWRTWERLPAFTYLSSSEQQRVREECRELLQLLVRPLGQHAALESDLDQRARLLEEALFLNTVAEKIVEEDQPQRVLLYQRGQLLRLLGKENEAKELLDQTTALHSRDSRDSRDLFLLGGEKASRGEFREALNCLNEAGRLAPQRADIWSARAACYAALGQQEKAISCWDTGIALQPNFWRAYLWRAQAYLDQKEYELAQQDLKVVLTQQANLAEGYYLQALAQIGLKDWSGAEENLTWALKLDPTHTRIYFTRSRVRKLAGNHKGALQDFEEGLRREPADEMSWTTRGEARMERDPQGALTDFEQALKLNRWSRNASQSKAYVLSEKLQRTQEAIDTLNPLIARYPDFVPARVGRGVLLARLGKRTLALRDAQEALRQDTSALNLYQVACVYALTSRQSVSDRTEAFRLLRQALQNNFGADLLETDTDLAALRDLREEFQQLRDLAQTLRERSQAKKR